MLSFSELIQKRTHIGHRTSRGNPKMAVYIWGSKNKVHIIDVSKTASQLERSAEFLKKVAAEGKEILWCGTKKAAQDAIIRVGAATQSPIAQHRWIGGTLTNFSQIKKSLTKLLHLEDVLEKNAKAEHSHYTKKELGVFQKMVDRLRKSVGGLRNLKWSVGALVVVDVKQEYVAVREAIDRNIPVVALVDTNSDPSGISYVIPANDDAPEAIACLLDYLAVAVEEGKKIRKETDQAVAADAEKGVVVEDALQAQLAAVEAALGGEDASKGVRKVGPGAPAGGRTHTGPRRTGGGDRSKEGGPRGGGQRPVRTGPRPVTKDTNKA